MVFNEKIMVGTTSKICIKSVHQNVQRQQTVYFLLSGTEKVHSYQIPIRSIPSLSRHSLGFVGRLWRKKVLSISFTSVCLLYFWLTLTFCTRAPIYTVIIFIFLKSVSIPLPRRFELQQIDVRNVMLCKYYA